MSVVLGSVYHPSEGTLCLHFWATEETLEKIKDFGEVQPLWEEQQYCLYLDKSRHRGTVVKWVLAHGRRIEEVPEGVSFQELVKNEND